MIRTHWLLPLIAASHLLVTTGCRFPGTPTPGEYDRGLLWVFPGVAGRFTTLKAVRAFREAGVDQAVILHNWDHLFGTFRNLMRYEGNRRDAAEIADRIAKYSREHAGRPIDLVGYSGGGGMAIFVAEALPDDVRVRRIVLVQPALSPEYDLSDALAHVTDRIVHFHSPRDWFILGWGTSLFGTMDRVNVASAGKDGFNAASAVPDPELRTRLDQRCWTKEMIDSGHWGNHAAITGAEWNRRYVAPLLFIER